MSERKRITVDGSEAAASLAYRLSEAIGIYPITLGSRHLGVVRRDLEAWLAANEWSSLEKPRGNMGFDRVRDPAACERAHFRATRP